MTSSQALVLILVFQAVLAISTHLSDSTSELDRFSTESSMRFASENVMLDLCLQIRNWVGECPSLTKVEIMSLVDEWKQEVSDCLNMMGFGCNISLGSMIIEPLGNQTLDSIQAGFLGATGNERMYVSATLRVDLELGGLHQSVDYVIRIGS